MKPRPVCRLDPEFPNKQQAVLVSPRDADFTIGVPFSGANFVRANALEIYWIYKRVECGFC